MLSNVFIALGASIVLAFAIEFLVMRMLVPMLRDSEKATVSNYRGARVAYGLGAVWIVFSIGYLIFSMLPGDVSTDFLLFPVWTALPLLLIALAAGLIDDAFGSGKSRGFKGHIRALLKGSLTTGGLKLFSVSAASFAFAWMVFGLSITQNSYSVSRFGYALLAGAGIALTGNLMNLTDLRPARASKVYFLCALVAIGLTVARLSLPFFALPVEFGPAVTALIILINAVWLCGPVLATFAFDAHEEAMLGDAGANAMGVFIGAYIIVHLGTNWWLIASYTAVMFALNLLSEKVSFSRIIAHNKVLSTLDNLGRLKRSEFLPKSENALVSNTDPEADSLKDSIQKSDTKPAAQEESMKIYGD